MIAALAVAALIGVQDARPIYDDAIALTAIIAACDDVLPADTWENTRRELSWSLSLEESLLQDLWEANRAAVVDRYSPTERRTHFTFEVCTRRVAYLRGSLADRIWTANRQGASQTRLERPQ